MIRAALLLAAPALGQPLSAIDWLSSSLEQPQIVVSPLPLPVGAVATPTPAGGSEIEVASLPPITRDGVGILSPALSGLPSDLWGAASTLEARRRVAMHPLAGPPSARDLFRRLLVAETVPPAGASAENGLLLARVDRLLDMGALDQAEALVLRADPEDPELFRRWFDIGLLTERTEIQCATLADSPALSPTLPARIFCLARAGDWDAAAMTLVAGAGVGEIDPVQELVIGWFLDPQFYEGSEPPGPPLRPTPLDHALRSAAGLPLSPEPLPPAFAYGGTRQDGPVRLRMMAGERLVRIGGLDPSVLLAAYRAADTGISGGPWERAAMIQRLDAALAADAPPVRLERLLVEAEARFAEVDLNYLLAHAYGPALAALTPRPPAPTVARLLFLSEPERAADWLDPSPDADLAAAAHLTGAPRPERLTETASGVIAGLMGPVPDPSDKPGIAILGALATLGATPDADDLAAALAALRAHGQEDAARAIGLEILLP